jgi:hypothetical protein
MTLKTEDATTRYIQKYITNNNISKLKHISVNNNNNNNNNNNVNNNNESSHRDLNFRF